jgi:UDP-2,3-diacylglucosamine pyrophosphatase LpxH
MNDGVSENRLGGKAAAMNDRPAAFFLELLNRGRGSPSTGEIDLRTGGKLLVISDLHMGDGQRDDLERNGGLVEAILDGYYFERGYTLVLNGDIEELLKHSLSSIRARWRTLYQIFDRFHVAGRLYKILGNHDEDLVLERHYPYTLYETVAARTSYGRVFIYHGHQGSLVYSRYNKLIALLVRHVLKPFGIGNVTSARSPRKRFAAEKRAYDFSRENGVISIIGHTHRPLFESRSRFEFIKFEIERYCRKYPLATDAERALIKTEVSSLREELAKLGKKERRGILRASLYGGDVPVPCLFNSGCVIGKKGITALEVDDRAISLVYWWEDGKGKKFVQRGNYTVETPSAFGVAASGGAASRENGATCGAVYKKATLNDETLENIQARMELLR